MGELQLRMMFTGVSLAALLTVNALGAEPPAQDPSQNPTISSPMSTDDQRLKECMSEIRSSHKDNLSDVQKRRICQKKIAKKDLVPKTIKR